MLDWDHNAYYHGELLKHLPSTYDQVLDVGCGAGALAVALAGRRSSIWRRTEAGWRGLFHQGTLIPCDPA